MAASPEGGEELSKFFYPLLLYTAKGQPVNIAVEIRHYFHGKAGVLWGFVQNLQGNKKREKCG